MSVREILSAALALLFETEVSAPDYVEKAPAVLSVMIPEVFAVNNELRVWKGLAPLCQWPEYRTLDDDVLLEPELCRAALPYGLATNLLLGDEEEGRAVNYNAKYADAVNACMRLRPEPVRDVYENAFAARGEGFPSRGAPAQPIKGGGA